jgi:hypothetical protein
MRIAAYISGHGFGHLAQMAPVLNRINQIKPDCQFLIRCDLPEVEIMARLDFLFDIESTQGVWCRKRLLKKTGKLRSFK